MTNEEFEEIQKEQIRIDNSFKKTEEEGIKNLLKYFDRIHDKLFSFNNILIAGYFALIKIAPDHRISAYRILIPLANLLILLYIEWKMMEKSRFEADIMNKNSGDIAKHGKGIRNTNLYSFSAILSTLVVTAYFVWDLTHS